MAIERRYLSFATAAVAIAAVPLSFFGPEGLRLAVIGLLMLAGSGSVAPVRSSPLRAERWNGSTGHCHRNCLQPRHVDPRFDRNDLCTPLGTSRRRMHTVPCHTRPAGT